MTNIPTPAPQTEMWTIAEHFEGNTTPWVGIYPTLEAAAAVINQYLQETFEDDEDDNPTVVEKKCFKSWKLETDRRQTVVYRDSDQLFVFYFTQHIK
jgi:hypothetical protein